MMKMMMVINGDGDDGDNGNDCEGATSAGMVCGKSMMVKVSVRRTRGIGGRRQEAGGAGSRFWVSDEGGHDRK
jgi:hypothetical protein